jgi:hypothetical protein
VVPCRWSVPTLLEAVKFAVNWALCLLKVLFDAIHAYAVLCPCLQVRDVKVWCSINGRAWQNVVVLEETLQFVCLPDGQT